MSRNHRPSSRPALPFLAWPESFASLPFDSKAILKSLQGSDRTDPGSIRNGQQAQLRMMLEWAVGNSPFYRGSSAHAEVLKKIRKGDEDFAALWRQLPLLTKVELRKSNAKIHASQLPPGHGPISSIFTSGSTGMPVEVHTTALTRAIWDALTMREHMWRQRIFSNRLGSVRSLKKDMRKPEGMDLGTWGAPASEFCRTGPGSAMHSATPVKDIAVWLKRFKPNYLIIYPSIAESLLNEIGPIRPDGIMEIRTISEPLDRELEERFMREWGVPCTEIYSAVELGSIAFRCKEHNALHAQPETLFVEILDDADKPCQTGETGRVVLTSLHNLATPLIRYEIGDYATVGAPCQCGRTSMVLEKVLGRVRNMLHTPDGRTLWPSGGQGIRKIEVVQQAQFVQTALDQIEVRVVLDRPLTLDETDQLVEITRQSLYYPFNVSIKPVEMIERGPTGKFEQFLSLLPNNPK